MTRRFSLCARSGCLLLALFMLAPRPALGQDAPSDEAATEARRAEAKAKYQAGVEAYERKRYKDAVDLFLAADRLAPSAPLSYNIGRAYERIGDDSSALRWYRDYLRRNASAQNAGDVREIVAKLSLALAKKGVQQVSIFSTPPGATISLDQQPVGVTPGTFDLPPGKHHVLLSLRGYKDSESDLELSANDPLDVSLRLDPVTPGSEPVPAVAPEVVKAPAPPAPPPPPQAAKSSGLGVWPWVTLGVGAAALGGAFTFEMLRRSAENDAEHESVQLAFQEDLERMESHKTTARVLLGVGGAVVAAGVVLLVLDVQSRQPRASVGFMCDGAVCGVRAGGRF